MAELFWAQSKSCGFKNMPLYLSLPLQDYWKLAQLWPQAPNSHTVFFQITQPTQGGWNGQKWQPLGSGYQISSPSPSLISDHTSTPSFASYCRDQDARSVNQLSSAFSPIPKALIEVKTLIILLLSWGISTRIIFQLCYPIAVWVKADNLAII